MTENKVVDACRIQAAESGEAEVIRDAEKALAGERVEAAERAAEVADGVVLPLAPADVEQRPPDEKPESAEEVDFVDPETLDEEHGRGLV